MNVPLRRVPLAVCCISSGVALLAFGSGLVQVASGTPVSPRRHITPFVVAGMLSVFAWANWMEARGRRTLIRRSPGRKPDGTKDYSVDRWVSLPAEAVVQQLRSRLAAPDSAIAGYAESGAFELWVIPKGANSFIPSMLGLLERAGDRTRILGWFPPRRRLSDAISLWIAAVAAITLILAGLCIAQGNPWKLLVVVPGAVVMAAFGLLLRGVGWSMSRGDESCLCDVVATWFPDTVGPKNGTTP